MPSFIDRAGQTFGRWTVLRLAPKDDEFVMWWCRCTCGEERAVRGSRLASGKSKSCGCLHTEIQRERLTGNTMRATHGSTKSREFRIWTDMLARCDNKNNPAYDRYGGRGIRVCDRWRKFENFVVDMGTADEGLTLDRINNDGPYSPENCRWTTRKAQANNRSSNRYITVDGQSKTITEWARDLGTSDATIRGRIKMGWSEDKAVTTPVRGL